MCGGPWRGFKFSVRGPQKLSFRAFSSRRSSLAQIFVESCVDFEVVHLSVLLVQRLPCPKIPTLTLSGEFDWTRRQLWCPTSCAHTWCPRSSPQHRKSSSQVVCSPSPGPSQGYWGPIPVEVGVGQKRSSADKVGRMTILSKDFSQLLHFLLKVVLWADDPLTLLWRDFTRTLFTLVQWWEWKWRYLSVYVGFL